jgi:hypothetical protein
MSENIADLDWSTIGMHLYGEVEEIPLAIQHLQSADPLIQRVALEFLLGEGPDFGELCPTTPYLIPIVLASFAQQAELNQFFILAALSQMIRRITAEQQQTFKQRRFSLTVYHAIKAGVPLYLTLLEHNNEQLRFATIDLLRRIDDQAVDFIALMQNYFEQTDDQDFQIALLGGIKALVHNLMGFDHARVQQLDQLIGLIKHIIATHQSDHVRVAAARLSVEFLSDYRYKHHLAQEQLQILQILEQEFLDPTIMILNEAGDDDSTLRMHIASDIARVSAKPFLNLLRRNDLSRHQIKLLIWGIIFHISQQSRAANLSYWDYYYDSVFDNERPVCFDDGSVDIQAPEIREILQSLVEIDHVWQKPTNVFSFFCGLPDTREELRALLLR